MSRQPVILMIPSGGGQPNAAALESLWLRALAAGLAREAHGDVLDGAQTALFYYGDWSTPLYPEYDEALDLHDTEAALEALLRLEKSKDFRRRNYEALPGQSALREFAADIASPVANALGLGRAVANRLLPELGPYVDRRNLAARELKSRVLVWLQTWLAEGNPVMLISHGFGNVLAYDALWSLTHEQQLPAKVERWLSLGSPLTDRAVQRQLQGADRSADQRYPGNVLHWTNFAAEDDHICHDKTAANDFAGMTRQQLIASLEDEVIYNLTVRYGRSAPHSSLGYLVHPKVARLVGGWITGNAR